MVKKYNYATGKYEYTTDPFWMAVTKGINIDRQNLPRRKGDRLSYALGGPDDPDGPDLTPLDLATMYSNNPKYGGNRYIDTTMLRDIDNYMISKNVGLPQRQAIAYTVQQEGNTTKSHGNGATGLVGWRGERAKGLGTTTKAQAAKLYTELYGSFNANNWNHGGKGSGYKSGKAAQQAFQNAKTAKDATHAMNYGYVRPPQEDRRKRTNNVGAMFTRSERTKKKDGGDTDKQTGGPKAVTRHLLQQRGNSFNKEKQTATYYPLAGELSAQIGRFAQAIANGYRNPVKIAKFMNEVNKANFDNTAQDTFFTLPFTRFNQRSTFMRNGWLEGYDGDYGLVNKATQNLIKRRKAAGTSGKIPVYQRYKDDVDTRWDSKEKKIIGSVNGYDLMPMANITSNTIDTYSKKGLDHALNYPLAIYLDRFGNFYNKGWDLNDYGISSAGKGGTTYSQPILQKAANAADAIFAPTVLTTGFKKYSTDDISYDEIHTKSNNGIWRQVNNTLKRNKKPVRVETYDDSPTPLLDDDGNIMFVPVNKKGKKIEVTINGKKK